MSEGSYDPLFRRLRELDRRNRGGRIRRARIAVFAAALLFIALRSGDVIANPAHHPDAVPTAAPGAPAMAPGAPMAAPVSPAPGMAPMAPMGTPPAPPGAPPGAPEMAGGGMGGMMGDMMGKMMGPAGGCMGAECGAGAPRTPIYSTLMTLPALTAEKRAEIDALASQQIKEGRDRHAKGHESLIRATQAGDHAAMQQAVGMMREGLDELGAGIAARRVLTEGKAPRNLALDWFKREMNLASPIAREESRAFLGDTPFHLLTMALLVAFALTMIAMYFFKMRRTAALFGRLEGGPGQSPPGSSPPLAGTPAPADSQPPKPSA